VIFLPIIIKAKKNDSTNDLIKKFKKVTISSNIVQDAKDRRYHQKPSKQKAIKVAQRGRLRKRMKSLKKMKNISPTVIQKMVDRLNT